MIENSMSEILKGENNLDKALKYATIMHEGQLRYGGVLYINHPKRVAQYVRKYKQSNSIEMLMMCAYLHDTLEDTKATYYDLVNIFGPQVASIVLELTTDEDLKKEIGKERYLEIKMKNMSSWALVIKLCDRLDNISDLENASIQFRQKYTKETLQIIYYLLENRELSYTQLNIIKQIIIILNNLEKYIEEDSKSLNLLECINHLELESKSKIKILKI